MQADEPLEALLQVFLGVHPTGAPEACSQLAKALAAMVASGRSAWPRLALDPARFVAHVAERLPVREGCSPDLTQIRSDDLYLACACVHGIAGAAGAFETHCIAPLHRMLAHLRLSPAQLDEVEQSVRTKLLVPEADRPAKLASYSGRGNLRSWVGVVATREALVVLGAAGRDVAVSDQQLMDVRSPAVGPELDLLKEQYREAFTQAFAEALAELSPRARNVLRHHYLHGLTIDEIGAMYGIHRSNAARRIAKARDTLLGNTRRRLVCVLRIDREELASIMRLVESRLDLSLRRALDQTHHPAAEA